MGYNDEKAPDSRIAHIQKTSELAQDLPDLSPCKKCGGFGEVAVYNDKGDVIGSKACVHCDGAGVEP